MLPPHPPIGNLALQHTNPTEAAQSDPPGTPKAKPRREKRHKCDKPECSSECSNKKDLDKHQREEHPPPKVELHCPTPGCPRTFRRQSDCTVRRSTRPVSVSIVIRWADLLPRAYF
jgi:hypothetical protein